MKKILLTTLLIIALTFSLTACANNAEAVAETPSDEGTAVEATENPTEGEQTDEISDYEPVTFEYDIYDQHYTVVYEQAPTRAVTLSQFMTEMLLALGLEDRMVGTAYMDNDIYPPFKEAYDSIPVLADKYPSKEVLFSVEPDFVSGWTSAFDEKRVASAGEMMENGMNPFVAKSISGDGSLETVYEDFRNLGKIFDVEDKAEEVISTMQSEIEAIQDQIGDIPEEEMVKVFVYDSGENEPFAVAGGGISGDIVRQAKGNNIFGEIEKGYASVSWEEVVERDPEVIVIVDYGDTDYESKVAFLSEHPALQELDAVKEGKFLKIGLADMSPGVRNTGAIETLAKGFYPERF